MRQSICLDYFRQDQTREAVFDRGEKVATYSLSVSR